jgi:hypothetical protein
MIPEVAFAERFSKKSDKNILFPRKPSVNKLKEVLKNEEKILFI